MQTISNKQKCLLIFYKDLCTTFKSEKNVTPKIIYYYFFLLKQNTVHGVYGHWKNIILYSIIHDYTFLYINTIKVRGKRKEQCANIDSILLSSTVL